MPEESKHELDSELDSDDSDYNPEADDQIIECIDCLSDHLLDDVMPADMYLGDDDDDDDEDEEKGEERENFFKQIQAHCKSCLPLFIATLQDDKICEGEYALSHTKCHESYVTIIEEKLEDIVRDFGYTFASFVAALRSAISKKSIDNPQKEQYAVELLEIIECVSKFSSFAEGMRIRAIQKITNDENFEFGRRFWKELGRIVSIRTSFSSPSMLHI